ncbi:NAD(P)-dependent oxidoreductase [Curvibacter sp. CHRR-16]|uniref:NAD(P)-dependent oxidoreductase n=1 Tax=Curvibacter sp. CHRR-16 TaxID=2835872 RepID=UPI001BDAC242|nr:NAD(P)-dependent oxidoreductase [Curvibacter sp. CHRR-16]MBT0568716.1 NAD(P)-dependent oxidoreductase [Curvibacter sp. CHRR-16]
MSESARIAFLGIGSMGHPMCCRLLQAGHAVHVWNRTATKAQALATHGAVVHESAADALAQADIAITMLENGAVVHDVLLATEAARALPAGALVIDMSSIQPVQAQAHAQQLQAWGLRALDAPVSGGTIGAEQGTLAIMVGGDAADFDSAHPVLAALGRSTHVGPHGSGQLAKLANQMIVGGTIGLVAEALLLCQRGGADMGKVRQAISGGFADSRVLQVHGQRMVDGDFAPRARMTVQLKDLRNALSTAQSLQFDTPITTLLEQLYAQAIDHGLADLDHAGLFVELDKG